MSLHDLKDKVCLVGVGDTAQCAFPDKTGDALAAEAFSNALGDCGLRWALSFLTLVREDAGLHSKLIARRGNAMQFTVSFAIGIAMEITIAFAPADCRSEEQT